MGLGVECACFSLWGLAVECEHVFSVWGWYGMCACFLVGGWCRMRTCFPLFWRLAVEWEGNFPGMGLGKLTTVNFVSSFSVDMVRALLILVA